MPRRAAAAPDSAEAGNGNSRKGKAWHRSTGIKGKQTTKGQRGGRISVIRSDRHELNYLPVSEIGHRKVKEEKKKGGRQQKGF